MSFLRRIVNAATAAPSAAGASRAAAGPALTLGALVHRRGPLSTGSQTTTDTGLATDGGLARADDTSLAAATQAESNANWPEARADPAAGMPRITGDENRLPAS